MTSLAARAPETAASEPDPGEHRTFAACIERLRDGKEYTFTNPNLTGYFHKAPYPAQDRFTTRDGASSAITYRDKETGEPASPTLMLYDFDNDNEAGWSITVGPWRKTV